MKLIIFVLSIFFATSCSKPEPREFSDDYVLIEFASKLEEHYHQPQPTPLESPSDSTKEESRTDP